MGAVAQEVCSEMERAARGRGNKLVLHSDGPLPTVAGDPVRLRQVLINLVDNAIKFTKDGEVVVAVSPDWDGVTVAVSDTGVGISDHDVSAIWDRFYKSDRMRTRNRGGSGLGLASRPFIWP